MSPFRCSVKEEIFARENFVFFQNLSYKMFFCTLPISAILFYRLCEITVRRKFDIKLKNHLSYSFFSPSLTYKPHPFTHLYCTFIRKDKKQSSVLRYLRNLLPFENFFFYTVILQIFGVVLFSVFSLVNGFTKIKKTPKCEKHIERSQQHPRTPKFKLHRTVRDCSPPKF